MGTEESGLDHAFLLDGRGGATRLDWEGIKRWAPDDGVLWLHLDYTAGDVARWLENDARIEPVGREALLDPDPRPRAVVFDDDVLVIVRGINQNQGSEPEDMVSIRTWLETRRVVTLRHRGSRSLQSLAADVERGKGPRSAGDLVVELVDRIVDHVSTRVDALHDAIADTEDRILSEKRGADVRAQLADHRRRAIALRRFLAPQREALTKLASLSAPMFDASHRGRLSEDADRMTRAIEELDAARDRAAITQEEVASHLAERANQRIYLLSIITAVFLPLGFVCSLLGVNIGGVPLRSSDWAFWALLGLFGTGVAIQLWWFRKRGWIKRD